MNAFVSKAILTVAGTAAIALTALPSVASAGEVNNRDHLQQARINQGVASGELTKREYNRDQFRLDRVENQRARDLRKDGGHLTAAQYTHLNRELNRNSNDIYFTKHDKATQPGG
jgi:uncharacterized protein involved in type VI secretion and phage assembly